MTERRPLASRNTRLASTIAKSLVRMGVAPNTISKTSIAFAVLAGAGFWLSAHTSGAVYVTCLLAAALGCQLRLLCNLMDGMVAVEGGRGAADGPFWNEVPDRVADCIILVGLGLAAGNVALGWSAAAAAIATAYLREMACANGLTADFRGPMAKPHRMALVTGAALLATFLPKVADLGTLEIALWALIAGTIMTLWRRAVAILAGLRSRS